jgi:hypothetical protein
MNKNAGALDQLVKRQHTTTIDKPDLTVGSYNYFKLEVPTGATSVHLDGNFTASGGAGNDIEAYVLPESDFVNWQNHHAAKAFYNSGKVTVGNFSVNLPANAGIYYLVFDNRFSLFSKKEVEVKLMTTDLLWRVSLFLALTFLDTAVHAASRMSGTYVAHSSNFVEMLQLTQTDNGQLTGVLSSIMLKADGTTKSEQLPITGTFDSGQLTINFRSGLISVIFGASTLSGEVTGGAIHLQIMDASGKLSTETFAHSTAQEFQIYSNQLKSIGQKIVFSHKLAENTQKFRETVDNAERWILNAELYAQRIPTVKSRYEEIESRMQFLVATERETPDSVARSQISVTVGQGDISGGQVDINVDTLWDLNIVNSGSDLYLAFDKWDGKCSTFDELRTRGASTQAAQAWETACHEALAEQPKFQAAFRRIMAQRNELKLFQRAAQSRRRTLVGESNRIQ